MFVKCLLIASMYNYLGYSKSYLDFFDVFYIPLRPCMCLFVLRRDLRDSFLILALATSPFENLPAHVTFMNFSLAG